jgi:predicted DNA-binding transcriptional regulator YafY
VPGDPLERLTNLVARLVHAKLPLSQAEIVDEVPGYAPGEAGRRAFERDKRVLRDQGVPLREDKGRYWIPPEEFFLPDLDLTAEERSALAIAIAAAPVGGGAAQDAIGKLGGFDGIGGSTFDALPHADLEEVPALAVLHGAARRRALAEFDYGGARRTVEPYALLFWDRFWYLFCLDRTRRAQRTFRVDRIEGSVAVGEPDSFVRPADLDVTMARPRHMWRSEVDEPVDVVVALDPVVAGSVVAEVGTAGTSSEGKDGTTLLRMQVSNRALFRSWLLKLLEHAEVVEPPDLRAEMVDWLAAMAGDGR